LRQKPTHNSDSAFSKGYPVGLYVKCAQVVRRLDEVLDSYDLSSSEKNNLIFYVAMYATCLTLKKAKPKPSDISAMNIEEMTDKIIDECFKEVRDLYVKLGGDDRTAKGPKLVDELKKRLQQKFIEPLKLKLPPSKGPAYSIKKP